MQTPRFKPSWSSALPGNASARPTAQFFFAACIVFLLASLARAQSVHWEPSGGSLAVGRTTQLQLVFENCAPNDQPTPPKVEDLTMQFAGSGTSTSIINGSVSSSETLTYAAALTKNHSVTIPAFTVQTNKGPLRVAAAQFDAGAATVGRSATPLSEIATARLTLTPASVWAGEVFAIDSSVEAARSYYPQFNRGFEWTPDPLLTESWSDPQPNDTIVASEPHAGFIYHTRAIARAPGRFNLSAATHIVALSVGVSGFGFFQQRQFDQYSIASNTPTLEVKALPPSPAGFAGAVGEFKLTSKIVPEKAAVGEPVTWTLELSGSGNWPDIPGLPSRDVSNDFQVVQPKAKRTPADGKIFDATLSEDVVLVPTKSGSYTLGPIAFTFFNPKTGAYETARTPRTTITIAAPVATTATTPGAAAANPETQPPEESAAAREARIENLKSKIPPPPAGIPRDPLPGSDVAPRPLEAGTLVAWVLAPFGAVLLLWVWLALGQARKTDPLRARREARARLAATLAALRANPEPSARGALILAWQRDAAVLWQIPHAAPSASAFGGAAPSPRPAELHGENDALRTAWSTLWLESDRALYGPQTALPADWLARAEAALAAKRLPGFQPLRLFLPRNLFPFAAVLALALAVPLSLLRAATDGAAAYRSGDFAAAEKFWRAAIAQHPTDSFARHNLSLALMQQERLGEAAAHAAAAFVQNPPERAIAWHFGLMAEKSGAVPAPLAAFVDPGPLQTLASRLSPSEWQRVIVAAAFGAALGLALLLFSFYRLRSRALRWTSLALFALGCATGAVATGGVLAYGEAADIRAVIVAHSGTLRSIPTEADTTQKTSPLAAGTLALADKTFLNDRWIHLVFENGQTGWERAEEIVPLWK
ncbi:MAG TPA: BatD family protein [Opitutaceae bacterium]|nr:BatD family protein [Opitutaceae bacterium]